MWSLRVLQGQYANECFYCVIPEHDASKADAPLTFHKTLSTLFVHVSFRNPSHPFYKTVSMNTRAVCLCSLGGRDPPLTSSVAV